MEITIELVVLYLYINKEHYNFVFNKLKAIIDDSSYKLPIYGINYQIKEPDSIFLKTIKEERYIYFHANYRLCRYKNYMLV